MVSDNGWLQEPRAYRFEQNIHCQSKYVVRPLLFGILCKLTSIVPKLKNNIFLLQNGQWNTSASAFESFHCRLYHMIGASK